MLVNFHTHTTFCDGKHTPEEVILAAIEQGLETLGFSGHCMTPFDLSYCMQDVAGYRKEVLRLKEKYRGQITILLGIEEDLHAQVDRSEYQYLIGSAHYLKCGERYCPVDDGHEKVLACIQTEFGGNPLSYARAYFEALCGYARARKPEIIGHFDLITKYDEEYLPPLLLGNPEYERMAAGYAREAAKSGCLFEVNTGAISRGLRKSAYPSAEILHALYKEGARIVLSSDSHSKDTLLFGLEEARALVREIGFREAFALTEDGAISYQL